MTMPMQGSRTYLGDDLWSINIKAGRYMLEIGDGGFCLVNARNDEYVAEQLAAVRARSESDET